MSNVYWKGGATAIAQVVTFTPADAPDAGDTTTILAADDAGNNYTLSVTGVSSVKDLVEAFKTAADAAKAAAIAPWNIVTATENDTVLTLTCDTAGKPVYFTETAGAGETFTKATPTANSGPNDWNTLANWIDASGVPATNLPGADASDTVYIEGDGTTNPQILYGLNQSAIANALTALYCTKCQIGSNGSAGRNPSYLQIKASRIEINYNFIGTALFSSPINIDNGTTATTIYVHNSATANNPASEPCVNLKVVEASTDIYVYSGKIGIAYHAGEVSTVDNIFTMGSSAYLYIGTAVTFDQIESRGGYTYCFSDITLANMYSGYLYTTKTITSAVYNGGTIALSPTAVLTAMTAISGASITPLT